MDLTDLEEGMPWRPIQDEKDNFKWIDHQDKAFLGTLYAVEPQAKQSSLVVASKMHAILAAVMCPSDNSDSDKREEWVSVDEDSFVKLKSQEKKTGFTHAIRAKSTSVTPKTVAASTGATQDLWLESIYKENENFLMNMAIFHAEPSAVSKFRAQSTWPLPCQMMFVF